MTRKTRRKLLEVMPRARRDLANLSNPVAKTSPSGADALVEQITRKMKWIAEVDFTGVPREELGPGIRAVPIRNRCIYFLNEPDRIVILRILHGAQDVAAQPFDTE